MKNNNNKKWKVTSSKTSDQGLKTTITITTEDENIIKSLLGTDNTENLYKSQNKKQLNKKCNNSRKKTVAKKILKK